MFFKHYAVIIHFRVKQLKSISDSQCVAKILANMVKLEEKLLKMCIKALTNYHVHNGHAQNSLLFPSQCHKNSLNH